MTSEHLQLRAFVDTLIRRERGLLAAALVLRALALAGLLIAGACLALVADLTRPQAAALLVLAAGVGALLMVVRPWYVEMGRAGDPLRQARLVEAREPSLAGWLVTAVACLGGRLQGESPEVVAWLTGQALVKARKHPPSEVHTGSAARVGAVVATAAWGVAVLSLSLVPGGSAQVMSWWAGSAAVAASTESVDHRPAEAPARVGDLTLRYVYPDYTGLEPYEVVNSTGEARAVPGTRVEVVAKSAVPVEAAALMSYEEPALDARVTDGRLIAGSFTVQAEPGSWRIVTWDHGMARSSKEFPIVPEADLAPEVTLQSDSPTLEVAINDLIELAWLARDDFGVTRVMVEIDGREVGAPLARPDHRQAEVNDTLRRRPADLGMAVGGTYQLVVAAWDNDTISGSKAGRSQAIRVVVLDEDGISRVSERERLEMLALLVDLLADHLEEPWPAGISGMEFARWGEALHERYQPVTTFVDSFRSRRGRLVADFMPVDFVLESGRTLIRYTQVSFTPDDRGAANADAVEAVRGLREEAIVTVEEAILLLDRRMRQEAMQQFADASKRLVQQAKELTDQVHDPEVKLDMIGATIDATDRMLTELQDHARSLQEGGLRDFATIRMDEIRAILQSAREAAAESRRPDVERLADRAQQRMQELADGITDELKRMREQAKKQGGKAKQLIDALKDVKARQDALAMQVQEIRESSGAPRTERMEALWEEIRAAAKAVQGGAQSYAAALEVSGRQFSEQELVGWALAEVEAVLRATWVQDLSGARFSAQEIDKAWRQYSRRFELMSRMEALPGPGASEIGAVRADIGRLLELVEVARRVDEAVDPATAAALQAVQGPQLQLESELRTLRDDAARLAEEFPVRPRGLETFLEQGDERMIEASDELGRAEGMQAQGSQMAASERVAEAIRSLQEAMASARSSSGGGKGAEEGGGEGDEEGEETKGGKPGDEGEDAAADKNGGEAERGREHFELPQPEEFRTPEAYRQALIEGMQGEVPDEYRALKQRYYEELVHQ